MKQMQKQTDGAMRLRRVAWVASILLLSSTFVCAQDYSNFTIELGTTSVIPDATGGIPVYPWFPDGHITMLPDGDTFQMYWAGSSSYRSVGPTIDNQTRNPSTGYALTKGSSNSDFDNGGAWLMSVFRKDGDDLIGFYHGEDHYWPGYENPDNIAWKSIAYCSSDDNGVTWTKGNQIITSEDPKPASPTWGGSGDACVVYDEENSRWVCFYQQHYIYTAISTNEVPVAGTWKKYYDPPGGSPGAYTEPGLGGKETPVPGLSGKPGANPSVHFNTHLKKWVMVWHTWDGTGIWLSVSDDLLNWATPQNIVSTASGARDWYATIIGQTDVLAGEYANLYWARWPDKTYWERDFLGASIRFKLDDNDDDGLPDDWENHYWPGTPVALISPDADLDQDGKSNLEEYLADTDPTNGESSLHIVDIDASSPSGSVLIWQSSEYKHYGVQMATNLTMNTEWEDLSSNIPATPPLNTFSNTTVAPNEFYRIKLEQD